MRTVGWFEAARERLLPASTPSAFVSPPNCHNFRREYQGHPVGHTFVTKEATVCLRQFHVVWARHSFFVWSSPRSASIVLSLLLSKKWATTACILHSTTTTQHSSSHQQIRETSRKDAWNNLARNGEQIAEQTSRHQEQFS